MKPIVGPRYHCQKCADFDFCHSCFQNEQHHNHPFEKSDGEGLPLVYVGPPGHEEIMFDETIETC